MQHFISDYKSKTKQHELRDKLCNLHLKQIGAKMT